MNNILMRMKIIVFFSFSTSKKITKVNVFILNILLQWRYSLNSIIIIYSSNKNEFIPFVSKTTILNSIIIILFFYEKRKNLMDSETFCWVKIIIQYSRCVFGRELSLKVNLRLSLFYLCTIL